MRKLMVLLCILCLAFGVADVVRAQPASEPAIEWEELLAPAITGVDWMIGFQFSPTSDMMVTDLGYYSPSGDSELHDVAIFDINGNFITGAALTGNGSDDFVYTDICPELLLSGNDYYILGDNSNAEVGYVLNELTINPSLNGIGDLFAASYWGDYTLGDPIADTNDISLEGGDTSTRQFNCGPNFKYTAVPIPGAMWLLGSGLIGLVGLRRRRG